MALMNEKDVQIKALVRLVLDLRKQLEQRHDPLGSPVHRNVTEESPVDGDAARDSAPRGLSVRTRLASEQRMREHAETALAATNRELTDLKTQCRDLRATVSLYASCAHLPAGMTVTTEGGLVSRYGQQSSHLHRHGDSSSHAFPDTVMSHSSLLTVASPNRGSETCTTIDSGVSGVSLCEQQSSASCVGGARVGRPKSNRDWEEQVNGLVMANESLRRELDVSSRVIQRLRYELSAQSR